MKQSIFGHFPFHKLLFSSKQAALAKMSRNQPNPPSMSKSTFTLGARTFPAVTWWKEPGLRALYAMLIIPLVTSMTNGYDGLMMNALQTSSQWQDYFGHPRGSLLAFYNLSFALGQLVAILPFPFPPTIADKLGRRWGIVIGSIISLIGVAIQSASMNCLSQSRIALCRLH